MQKSSITYLPHLLLESNIVEKAYLLLYGHKDEAMKQWAMTIIALLLCLDLILSE